MTASGSERALVVDEQKFQNIIEASPVAYALNDEQQNITYLNPEFVRTFGYTRAEIPTLQEWWPRAYPDPVYRAWVIEEWGRRLAVSRETGASFEPMELEIRAADGSSRIVVVYAIPLAQAFSGTHLVVLYNITKLREAELEQRRLHEMLAHAQRVESLGRLAGGVAHDNNNMLAVILGSVEVALRNIAPDHPIRSELLHIRAAAERSADLMRQLLAYARKQPVTPRVIAMTTEIADMVHMLRPLVGANVQIAYETIGELWPVRVDPTQLRQVVANLVLNAKDASGGHGTITIVAENVAREAVESSRPVNATPADYVRVAVTDQGSGMTEEVMARAFEPFFTTKTDGRGTGLGLAMVEGIVQQAGGFVTVESRPGAGSTFALYLPGSSTPA